MNQRVTRSLKLGQQVLQNSGIHTSSVNKNIIHDKEKKLFVMPMGEDNYAWVEYVKDDGVFDLVHSEVPEKFRGQGYGKILAKSVFDYLQQNHYKMKLTCDFLRRYYNDNINDYSDLIA